MNIGFTGTRHGLTAAQRFALRRVLERYFFGRIGNHRFTHGDCVGADKQAHNMVRVLFGWVSITVRPSERKDTRAFCNASVIMAPKEPLARNKDIVREADVVVACPSEPEEMSRGGTWFTVRHARKLKKELVIVYPNGKVEYDL